MSEKETNSILHTTLNQFKSSFNFLASNITKILQTTNTTNVQLT